VSAGTKYRGGKLGCIIGLAKIKAIFGCNSARLWYTASFVLWKCGPPVFTLSDVAAQHLSQLFLISEQFSAVTQMKMKYGNSNGIQ